MIVYTIFYAILGAVMICIGCYTFVLLLTYIGEWYDDRNR